MKHALITGAGGQDGAYLSLFLLDKNYRVYGIIKPRTNIDNLKRLGIFGNKHFTLIEGDITDSSFINDIVLVCSPDEIYNLAAQSHVGYSFKVPQITCSVNYMGYLNVLLAARKHAPNARIYQAGTSEMFGYAAQDGEKQNEFTPFQPMSPYGISKVAAHWAGVNARYEANQFVANGILFNHESPLRDQSFVTRKIIHAVARMFVGHEVILSLGNFDSRRDWGHAADYVRAMWMMLQHDKPDDFVVATGETRSVRDFLIETFKVFDKEIKFCGTGFNEVGIVDGEVVVKADTKFYRPNDLTYLCGDSSKIRSQLNWSPKISFRELVDNMVCAEIEQQGGMIGKELRVCN